MKSVLIVLMFTYVSLAQDDSILKLFPGKWKMENDEVEYYEEWKIINDTELLGSGYTIEKGSKIESEAIYLKKFGTECAYVAIPKDQAITLFALTNFSENKFVFENGEHDFPQRIIYKFNTDDNLFVVIDGTVNGEIKRSEFKFTTVMINPE